MKPVPFVLTFFFFSWFSPSQQNSSEPYDMDPGHSVVVESCRSAISSALKEEGSLYFGRVELLLGLETIATTLSEAGTAERIEGLLSSKLAFADIGSEFKAHAVSAIRAGMASGYC